MAAVEDAVDVCLAVGRVVARVEEIVVAEVDIMVATVEMVEGEGWEEEMVEEEMAEEVEEGGEMAEAEEEEEEETAEGVSLLAAVPSKVGNSAGSGGDIRGVREKHDQGTNTFAQNSCTFMRKYMTTRAQVIRIIQGHLSSHFDNTFVHVVMPPIGTKEPL